MRALDEENLHIKNVNVSLRKQLKLATSTSQLRERQGWISELASPNNQTVRTNIATSEGISPDYD